MEFFDGDILPVFCPTSQLEFRNMRNSLNRQRSATVHGVVFDVSVELARDVGALSTLGKAGCALLTACWQQGRAMTTS
jgi:hypothetical protein